MFSKTIKILIGLFFFLIITIVLINYSIINTTKQNIITKEESKELKNIDCILILGASIKGNYPSPMLEDRLKQGLSLYKENITPKIIVSGDHMTKDYDEVNVMKDYLVGHGAPSQDVFMDHAGISTYDSVYRAKHIFKLEKMIIVTQEYHLYRALYIADNLGIEAYGVSANLRDYTNQEYRDIREIFARTKDFFKTILKSKSTYLGEEISIKGNGDITND